MWISPRPSAPANNAERQAVALEAARRSLVLLKNDRSLLPLDRAKLKTIAVVGPNAKGVHLGGYSRILAAVSTCSRASPLRRAAGVRIAYSEGTRITEEPPNWDRDKVVIGDPAKNRQRIQEAVKVARQADAIVVVVGTNESTSREAWADKHLGDAADLVAHGQAGRPGRRDGANGKAGRRRPDQRPAAGDSAGRRTSAGDPRRPGIRGRKVAPRSATCCSERSIPAASCRSRSHDTRSASGLLQSPADIVPLVRGSDARAAVGVRPRPELHHVHSWCASRLPLVNRDPAVARRSPWMSRTPARRAGDEVVQLYIHDVVSSVTRPVKELAGFERVTLGAGREEDRHVHDRPGRAVAHRSNACSGWWNRAASRSWSAPARRS